MQMWKAALGVEATIEAEEFRVYLQRIKAGDFQMTVLGYHSSLRDPYDFLLRFKRNTSLNEYHYANPAVDKLLDAADITLEPDARRDLNQEAERIVGEDVPGIPSQVNAIVALVSPRLKGWVDDNGYPQSRWFTLED